MSRKTCFTPNPFEYFLLADKQRMIDWSNDSFWDKINIDSSQKKLIQSILLKTLSFNPVLKEFTSVDSYK